MKVLDVHSHVHFGQMVVHQVAPDEAEQFISQYPQQPISIGIHPWKADTTNEHDIMLLEKWMTHPNVVALGETGLDKRSAADFDKQKQIFEQHIELSESVQKPLLIHSVAATGELLAIRKRCCPIQKWILHGFRGNPVMTKQLLNKGLFLSFGVKFNKEAMLATPVDRLYLETDTSDISIETVKKSIEKHRNMPNYFIL